MSQVELIWVNSTQLHYFTVIAGHECQLHSLKCRYENLSYISACQTIFFIVLLTLLEIFTRGSRCRPMEVNLLSVLRALLENLACKKFSILKQ